MLTDKRIKEAEANIPLYLEQGLLKKTTAENTQKIFMQNAKESMKAAKLLHENNIPLWTIVSAYYAMFYMANAVLNNLGYKTGEKIVHKVTADALIVIVQSKLKNNILEKYEEAAAEALELAAIQSNELIATFDYERKKRSTIQYNTTREDLQVKAETSLTRAREFIFAMEGIV